MSFDKPTRNRLQSLVASCRRALQADIEGQLQSRYGMYRADERIQPMGELSALSFEDQDVAAQLRDLFSHYRAQEPDFTAAYDRLVNGIGFTALNRLVALRLAEERGLVVECVRKGLDSEGFRIYQLIVEDQLGTPFETYRFFLHLIFDEMAEDARFLFDRRVPQGLVFPSEPVLRQVLTELGEKDLIPLWKEDETIGWIYQYYNSQEERKKMREESSAPRNSRELAVRNQFFTPRYVVEFLTDNTLGRIWYEMTKGHTQLSEQCRYLVRRPTEIFLKPDEAAPETTQAGENLSQEELLRQPVHIPHRPLKDPREIRLLDPACGSMHFGLYAFDLFTTIYEEAWEIARGADDAAKSAETFAPYVTFASSFADKAEFLREVPRLIVEHNIHGIDIDPRAVQIAGLSLWLRAQRAWHQDGVKPADRPRISRSNIVCAEPMPGEKDLLREFVEQQFPATERPAFGFLLETIFDRMSLAGEAGSLLRIEEEIRATIEEARSMARSQGAKLFIETGVGKQAEVDLRAVNDEQFWQAAEQRIYDALEAYADQAENDGGFQRRLFADDAAQGFAFIDLCRKRYDVVVMNPPFGEFSLPFRDIAATQFAAGSHDIITAFVERGAQLKADSGFVGVISSRTVFFAPTSANWRKRVASREGIAAFVELGGGVLDGAMVEVCMYVLGGNIRGSSLFVRPKTSEGEFVLTNFYSESGAKVYVVSLNAFEALDGMPFAYWLDEQVFWCLSNLPRLEKCGFKVRVGLQTGDDFRFIRLWSEVPSSRLTSKWFPHAKGGENSPFYTEVHLVVNWKDGGNEIKAQPSVRLNMYSGTNPDLYLAPGMTFSYRTNRFSPAALPRETITGVAGMGVFAKLPELLSGLAFLNSSPVNEFISARLGLLEINALYQAGTVQPTPVPNFTNEQRGRLTELGSKLLSLVRGNLIAVETSRLFGAQSATTQQSDRSVVEAGIVEEYEAIDGIVAAAYGFNPQAAANICASGLEEFRASIRSLLSSCSVGVSDHLAYALGCVFGRWDIRYATGERPAPELPDPFAPLPVCPPGMLQGDDGLPLSIEEGRRQRAEGLYPLDVAWDGILVDDQEHPLDIERRVHAALSVIWGDRSADLTAEACEMLGVGSLRDYFRRPAGFFADHLKRYSKSRRQAPIYWPLSTASGNYTLWIYYHRLDEQTLYRAVEDFVRPKLASVERERDSLEATLRDNVLAAGKDREKLQNLRAIASELADFRDELLRVAAFPYKPDLNDGVVITAAPLRKLFRLKPWVKTLDEVWKKLEKGDYDWAHMAFHLWPDRVRAKCVKDRSLAIAHDLESICTAPDPTKSGGQKRGRKKKEAALIEEDEE